MREITKHEQEAVSGGVTNYSSQTKSVSVVNSSVSVEQVTVQQNGETLVNKTRIRRRYRRR